MAIDTIYNYFKTIGIDGKQADQLVTRDLALQPKPNALSKFLFSCLYKNSDLAEVIHAVKSFATDDPHLQHRRDFIRAVLENLQLGRDPKLKNLRRINEFAKLIDDKNYHPLVTAEKLYIENGVDAVFETIFSARMAVAMRSKGHENLLGLPNDILIEIFSHLDLPALHAVRRTCTVWNEASTHIKVWNAVLARPENALLHASTAHCSSFALYNLLKKQLTVSSIKHPTPLQFIASFQNGFVSRELSQTNSRWLVLFTPLWPSTARSYNVYDAQGNLYREGTLPSPFAGEIFTVNDSIYLRNGETSTFHVVDIVTGTEKSQIKMSRPPQYMSHITFDKNNLFLVGNNQIVRIYNLQSGVLSETAAIFPANAIACCDGKVFFKTANDKIAYKNLSALDDQVDDQDQELPAHSSETILTAQENLLFTHTIEGEIAAYDLVDKISLGIICKGNFNPRRTLFHNGILFLLTLNNKIEAWDVSSKSLINRITPTVGEIVNMQIAANKLVINTTYDPIHGALHRFPLNLARGMSRFEMLDLQKVATR
jgi:hypothetical protein